MDQRGSRGHQWQSQDYAAFWVADAEARDDDRIEQLRLLANLIPHPHDAPIRVLDLGAGYGIVTSMVLARFPNARVTLFDLSEAMLAHARPRLAAHADQLDWALGDLTTPAWVAAVRGPYDAVVSAAVLHNLGDGPRIAAIYGELVGLLRPGGAFLCYDHVSAGGPRIEQQFDALRPTRRHGDEAVRAAAREPAAYPHDHGPASTAVATPAAPGALRFPGGIAAHLDWLRAAGFAEADCFWKLQHQCLYGGYMPE
jgi:tRNA (cmo5U34)-methyltransferase